MRSKRAISPERGTSQEARRLLAEGNIPDALFVAEKATQSDGNNAEAWAALAEARFRWGDIEDAICEYRRAIKLCPNEAAYYFDFGSVLESVGRLDDALQQAQRAAQIDPGTTMYRAALGSLLVKKQRYAEGIKVLEQCRREQSDNPTYQWFLAIAYDASSTLGWTHVGEGHPLVEEGWYATEYKHITDAQESVNKALALTFDDPDLMEALQEHRKLIDQNLRRKLMCNWFAAGVIGIIGILGFLLIAGSAGANAPHSVRQASLRSASPATTDVIGALGMASLLPMLSILYVISSSTPQYRINKRLVQGKHFNEFAAVGGLCDKNGVLASLCGDYAGCFALPLTFTLIAFLMPFVTAINFYRNWITVPSTKTSFRYAPNTATIAGRAGNGLGLSGPSDTLVLHLKLVASGLKRAFLQMYCSLRRRRESGSQESWLLLTLLPPAGAFCWRWF